MHTEQHRTGHRATRYWKQSNTGLDTEQHGTGHRATRYWTQSNTVLDTEQHSHLVPHFFAHRSNSVLIQAMDFNSAHLRCPGR
eukprot:scaffold61478_cov22-Tisochrysis_lutea.AAC.1